MRFQAWDVKLDSQVAFRSFCVLTVADECEAVTELEVGLSDDVAFESRSGRNTEVTATAQSEDQLFTGWHRRRAA